MKRAIEEKVVTKESNPGVLYRLNQQPEHSSPQDQSSDLYGHFIQSLCKNYLPMGLSKNQSWKNTMA